MSLNIKAVFHVSTVTLVWVITSTAATADVMTEFSDRKTFENAVGVALTVEDFTDIHHVPLESAFLNSETECLSCTEPLFPGDIQPGVTYFANGNPNEPAFFNIDFGGHYSSTAFLDGLSPAPWNTTHAEITFWRNSPGNSRSVSAFGFDCAFQDGSDLQVTISFDHGPDQVFTYPDEGPVLTFFGFQSDATDIRSVSIGNIEPVLFGFDFDNFTFPAPTTGPELVITGSCPGLVTLQVTGLTPNSTSFLFASAAEGSFVIANGRCAGVELGLDNPHLILFLFADADGDVTVTGHLPANVCENFVQAFDRATCQATAVSSLNPN